MPPNLLAHYPYLWEPTVVWQAIDTAWISPSSGGHSLSYRCQQRRFRIPGLPFDTRALAKCANAPKEVPSHQGIMLCPGQSAIMRIELPVPKTPDRAI